jgi:transcriptional repressor NrdR
MKCPYCQHLEDRVLESRVIREGETIKRRRECLACGRRFTTNEIIVERRLMVVKKDGRREPFDRQKILRGLEVACRKRPVSMEDLERTVDEIERELFDRGDYEVPAVLIGERVAERVRDLDPVAYVRFASVYRDFRDVEQFSELLDRLRDEAKARRPARRPSAGPEEEKTLFDLPEAEGE